MSSQIETDLIKLSIANRVGNWSLSNPTNTTTNTTTTNARVDNAIMESSSVMRFNREVEFLLTFAMCSVIAGFIVFGFVRLVCSYLRKRYCRGHAAPAVCRPVAFEAGLQGSSTSGGRRPERVESSVVPGRVMRVEPGLPTPPSPQRVCQLKRSNAVRKGANRQAQAGQSGGQANPAKSDGILRTSGSKVFVKKHVNFPERVEEQVILVEVPELTVGKKALMAAALLKTECQKQTIRR